jgi:Uncharacterized protein conserved in bacteria (DUF2334)
MTGTRSAVFFLAVLFFLFGSNALAETLILYDNELPENNGIILSNMLIHLASHFDPVVQSRNVESYQRGLMDAFDHVMFIGTTEKRLPILFRKEAADGTHRMLWIDGNLWQLDSYLGEPSKIGFRETGWNAGADFAQIDYKERLLGRDDQDWSFTEVTIDGLPTVFSELVDTVTGNRFPYFLCGNDFCYLADNPFYSQFSDDRYFAFADFLHIFYQTTIPESRPALLRLEDLAPGISDPELLRDLTDELAEMEIPFSFGVIPIFKDPEGLYFPPGTEFRLSNDPELVDVLNYMLENGGTMLMHGVTHQHDNGISRADWEFSLGLSNEPLPYDSEIWARDRLLEGMAEFDAVDLHPGIWETPHYSASHGDYLVFSDYFDTRYERPLVFPLLPEAEPVFGENLGPEMQLIPFYCPTGVLGMGLLPENLGYIDRTETDMAPEDKLEIADRLSIIRDGVASLFIHPADVTHTDIFAAIDGLLDRGYTFVSPDFLMGATSDDDDDDDDDDDSIGENDEVQGVTGDDDQDQDGKDDQKNSGGICGG